MYKLLIFFGLIHLPVFSQIFENSYSGYISIIDKSDKTKGLFDYSDPFSLMSIISTNKLHDIKPLPFYAEERILKENPSVQFQHTTPIQQYDAQGQPLLQVDLDGEPLIRMNPQTGVDEMVPAPPIYHNYDLTEITKIIVFEDTLIDPITNKSYFGIDKIGFAKKYPGSSKFDVVCVLPFELVSKLDGFNIFFKLTQEETKSILLNKNSFYQQINFIGNSNDKNHFPLSKTLEFRDSLIDYTQRRKNLIHFKQLNYLKVYPYGIDFNSSDQIESKKYNDEFTGGGLLFSEPPFLNSLIGMDSMILKNFKTESFLEKDKGIVLIDPITGDEVVNYNKKTKKYDPVYLETKEIISYIYNDNPTIYLKYNFVYNDSLAQGQNNAYIQSIYFCTKTLDGKDEFCTLKMDLYEKAENKGRYGINLDFSPEIDKYVIKDYTSKLDWMKFLSSEKIDCYDTTKKNDVKKLETIFNLESDNGVPSNLLGIISIEK